MKGRKMRRLKKLDKKAAPTQQITNQNTAVSDTSQDFTNNTQTIRGNVSARPLI